VKAAAAGSNFDPEDVLSPAFLVFGVDADVDVEVTGESDTSPATAGLGGLDDTSATSAEAVSICTMSHSI
jgi:hypothetical protein